MNGDGRADIVAISYDETSLDNAGIAILYGAPDGSMTHTAKITTDISSGTRSATSTRTASRTFW